jgi:hypothetical protein
MNPRYSQHDMSFHFRGRVVIHRILEARPLASFRAKILADELFWLHTRADATSLWMLYQGIPKLLLVFRLAHHSIS